MEIAVEKVALAFMAHPDDAEILCAGTLIRLRDLGWEIHIAAVAAGDCGTMTLTADRIIAVRRDEAQRAAGLIGGAFRCLDERDGLIVYDKPTLAKAIDLFRRIAPTLVFTHAPRDYMVDHEMASLLARGASFIYGAPNVSALPRLARSGVPCLYYCDPLEGKGPLGEAIAPTTLVDISLVMDRKCAMLACHASQRGWLRAHHGMDEYLESMRRQAEMRGKQAGCRYAEGFVQHRGHAYPQDDLLKTILAS